MPTESSPPPGLRLVESTAPLTFGMLDAKSRDATIGRPAILHIRGKADRFAANECWLADGWVHTIGRWRHLEGAHNETARFYGEQIPRSWPRRDVPEIRWTGGA
jgi:hypothetical protein